MLSVDNVTLQYGARKLFQDLSFSIGSKDRIAFVGPNGAGKSTLMKIIAGIEVPDEGKVAKPKDAAVGYLPQEGIHISGTELFAEVETAFGDALAIQAQLDAAVEELEHIDYESDEYPEALTHLEVLQSKLDHHDVGRMKPRIETVLQGLGFKRSDFTRDCGEFSGGWQMRIALSKLLLQEPEVLLLDEPTNHLDLDSQQWIESFLHNYAGAIILISHDRAFLDSLVKRVLAYEGTGKVEEYAGNYSYYERERGARRELVVRAYKNQQREIERAEKLIDRFRAKASKAAMAQSRIKALDKVERIEIDEVAAEVNFQFPQPPPSGHTVASLTSVTKKYGDLTIFKDFDFEINKDDRIAIVGVNGAGKSTFSRLVSGQEDPTTGERKLGHKVEVSFFSQNHADELDPKRTVLETVEAVASRDAAPRVRSLLGSFLFRGDDVFKTIGVLSGGERSRVALARMLVQPANFLILDEPTNHLDMASQETLQRALNEYTGTYLIVSHNRAFLDPVVTKVLEFIPGQSPRLFLGNVTDYLDKKKAEVAAAAKASAPQKGAAGSTKLQGANRKEQRRLEAQKRQARAKNLKPLQAELAKIEKIIADLEKEKADVTTKMQDPVFFEDQAKAKVTAARFKEIDVEIQNAYTEWSRVSEELEALEI